MKELQTLKSINSSKQAAKDLTRDLTGLDADVVLSEAADRLQTKLRLLQADRDAGFLVAACQFLHDAKKISIATSAAISTTS